MKAIRINTLGIKVTLIFTENLNAPISEKHSSLDGSEYAFVIPDIRYTVSVVTQNSKPITPELVRSVQIYLRAVLGLPQGEYDLLFNDKSVSYYIKNGLDYKYGGNVGKCKLLSSKTRLNSNNYPLDFSEISCGNQLFRISECQRSCDFDLEKIGSLVCMQPTPYEPPFGFLTIEDTQGARKVSFYRFATGVVDPPSTALCAAAYYAMHGKGLSTVNLRVGNAEASVSIDARGLASLYTNDFSFIRL